MRIGLTGASGFLGRYLVAELAGRCHDLVAWRRPTSDLGGLGSLADAVDWFEGDLRSPASAEALCRGADAIVHAALDRPGEGFRGAEGDPIAFVEANVVGTIRLIESARRHGVGRFVFISTCAVHEVILDDRPLDEAHPLWPTHHYGAHKAALEAFVSSYGRGEGYPICALRPTGIYGLDHPPERSKWSELVRRVASGEAVDCTRGGKEVHAGDVARAVSLLLDADQDSIAGQAFNCYDRYISEHEVASIARELTGSAAEIRGEARLPKHEIETGKIRSLGMAFGGTERLRQTVGDLLRAFSA